MRTLNKIQGQQTNITGWEERTMKKGAIISPCETYRYKLWRIWNNDKPKVLFICLNPSIADDTIDDPTIRRIIKFAHNWGYGGFYIGNLFAYRATEPQALLAADKAGIDIIGRENDGHIEDMRLLCSKIIFAWGNYGSILGRGNWIAGSYYGHCLGKNANGSPKHPLYIKSTTQPIKF